VLRRQCVLSLPLLQQLNFELNTATKLSTACASPGSSSLWNQSIFKPNRHKLRIRHVPGRNRWTNRNPYLITTAAADRSIMEKCPSDVHGSQVPAAAILHGRATVLYTSARPVYRIARRRRPSIARFLDHPWHCAACRYAARCADTCRDGPMAHSLSFRSQARCADTQVIGLRSTTIWKSVYEPFWFIFLVKCIHQRNDSIMIIGGQSNLT